MHKMLFIIGAPRSGTTLLERMLSSHSCIKGGPEPHLLTPLAHLGLWSNVDKAPYDHVLAAEAQKQFVASLPLGMENWWKACRAYCDVLYSAYMDCTQENVCLDKTPAYALVWPFVTKVFPDAHYIVLTRHPVALFSSYANSFFNGDYAVAEQYNPLLDRYVPALAAMLRSNTANMTHLQYEQLVKEPEASLALLCESLAIPYEAQAVAYGEHDNKPENLSAKNRREGLGDPIGIKQHTKPTTTSVAKWVEELKSDPEKEAFMRRAIDRLAPEDLATLGYPIDTLWAPLDNATPGTRASKTASWNRYRVQRACIIGLRAQARKHRWFRRFLEKLRLATEVLLRE